MACLSSGIGQPESSERSLADANRPERRSVLDLERMRAVAVKQEEALAAARAAAEEKAQKKQQVRLPPR